MKKKQAIKKLQLLQLVQPDNVTLRAIHKTVLSEIPVQEQFSIREWLSISPVIQLVAFGAVVIFLSVLTRFMPDAFEKALVYSKIAAASNQYEKAKIAFAYVNDQFSSMKNNSFDSSKMESVSQALTLANTQMSGLKLVGEKGKYTSQQCLELYEAYHTDLKNMDRLISSKASQSAQKGILASEVEKYDQQSEKKLHNYKKQL